MFCGHLHVEPTQILTGEVRVEIKPSEPNSRFPPWGAAARGRKWKTGPLPASLPGLRASRPEKGGRGCLELQA